MANTKAYRNKKEWKKIAKYLKKPRQNQNEKKNKNVSSVSVTVVEHHKPCRKQKYIETGQARPAILNG